MCESILLSLTENGIINAPEGRAILEDAVSAHREAARLGGGGSKAHADTATLPEGLLAHGNSVRHADR